VVFPWKGGRGVPPKTSSHDGKGGSKVAKKGHVDSVRPLSKTRIKNVFKMTVEDFTTETIYFFNERYNLRMLKIAFRFQKVVF